MKVGLTGGREASESDISALESVIGQPLDNHFRKFLLHNNGARPEGNSFPVNGISHMGAVHEFLPIENIVSERTYIDQLGPHAYPIALSAGGNYVLLDQDQDGAILFWDHEVEGGVYKVADNFDIFLSMLEPFDASMIELAPGQVKYAWIDPDLLK